MSKRWYVVQAYSGFEKNVQKTLKERIARENMEDYFGQILVPVEEVVDIKNGRKPSVSVNSIRAMYWLKWK